ncbi:hypothetical protein ACLOJK_041191, partial [Asimina triloba]
KADSESRYSQEQEESGTLLDGGVTSFLCLKPRGPQEQPRGVLDKDVVLRRIRQRKRATKVRSAIQAVVGGISLSAVEVGAEREWERRWPDDAFSAP